jgi:hypothetical protein
MDGPQLGALLKTLERVIEEQMKTNKLLARIAGDCERAVKEAKRG